MAKTDWCEKQFGDITGEYEIIPLPQWGSGSELYEQVLVSAISWS